jgi:hypothetical protein
VWDFHTFRVQTSGGHSQTLVQVFGLQQVWQLHGSKQHSQQVVLQWMRLPGLQYVSVTHSPHFF